MITELEQKIIELLASLSEEAKRKARFVFRTRSSKTCKKNQKFLDEKANLIIGRFLK